MKLSEKQQRFTENIAKLIIWGISKGYKFTFGEGDRTTSQQILYYTGYEIALKENKPVLVKTKRKSHTMHSKHLNRMAHDLNIFDKNGKYITSFEDTKEIGDYWESLDPANVWGGDWNKNDIEDGFMDTPHFQSNL
jgi:hypothetical protein